MDQNSYRLDDETAAMVESEAIIDGCTPEEVVGRALGLYAVIAPELRNGGRLLVEIDVTNDTITNRRGLGKLATGIKNRLDGHPGRTILRLPIQPSGQPEA